MTFGGRVLFDDTSFTVNYGDRVALVGPNGAGKTTLFSIILKQLEPDAGTVERDEKGFILTGADLLSLGKPPKSWSLEREPLLLEASVPGVFAAGDVRADSVKRVAAAVGEGAITVHLVHQYLADL